MSIKKRDLAPVKIFDNKGWGRVFRLHLLNRHESIMGIHPVELPKIKMELELFRATSLYKKLNLPIAMEQFLALRIC